MTQTGTSAPTALDALTPDEQLAASRRLHWMNMLDLHAQGRPDVEAFVGQGERYTWKQLHTRVSAVAADLQERGVARGDRVFILGLNSVSYVTALLAINTVGAIAAPLNIRSTPADVDYLVGDAGAVVGFADQMGAGILADAQTASQVPLIRFGEEFEAIAASGRVHTHVDVAETETALIVYTSGTTSAPKGAMLTHMNMVSQTINTNRMSPAAT
ncbi:MAG TPA: AMP-binding protein, partial [Brevibacterium sp.]|nr:AMP-binding protein [Brevibacterium sp.]